MNGMDWLYSILGGIVSGFLASIVFLAATRFLRPKIFISEYLSVYPTDSRGNEVVRMKIVNLRRRPASDVSVQVFVQHVQQVHGGPLKVRKRVGNRFTSHMIQARKLRDKEFDNARRIRIDDEHMIKLLAENSSAYVVVEVFARDAVSGVGGIFRREYPLSTDSFQFGSFELGNGGEIKPYAGPRKYQLPERVEEARRAMQGSS